MDEFLYIDESHDVLLEDVKLATDGTALTGGTATWSLLDESRTIVTAGATGSLTSTGNNYAGQIPATYTSGTYLTAGRLYYVKIAFAQGNDALVVYLRRTAKYHDED